MAKAKRRKKVKVRRLYKMQPAESAFVPYGANNRTFAVVKESDIMKLQPKLIASASQNLAEVVSVLKAGNLDEAATTAVNEKMDLVLGDLAKGAGFELSDSPATAPKGLLDGLKELAKGLKALESEARTHDLGMADRVSAMTEKAEEMANAEPADADAAEGADADAAADDGDANAAATDEDEPAEGATKDSDADAADAADADENETGDDGADEGAGDAADAAADAGSSDDVVTKADLMNFMKEMKDMVTKSQKETAKAAKVAKEFMAQIPGTQHSATPEDGSKPDPNEGLDLAFMDLTQSPELKDLKLPE